MSGTLSPNVAGNAAAVLFDASGSTVAFPGGVLTADGDTFSFQPHWNYANRSMERCGRFATSPTRGQRIADGLDRIAAAQRRSAEHSALRARHRHERSAHDCGRLVVVTTTSGWVRDLARGLTVWHRSQIMDLAYASTTANLFFLYRAAEPGGARAHHHHCISHGHVGERGFVDAMLDFPRTPARSRFALPRDVRVTAPSPVQSSPTNDNHVRLTLRFDGQLPTIFTDLPVASSSTPVTDRSDARVSPFGLSLPPGIWGFA